jgi:hypothetical protein
MNPKLGQPGKQTVNFHRATTCGTGALTRHSASCTPGTPTRRSDSDYLGLVCDQPRIASDPNRTVPSLSELFRGIPNRSEPKINCRARSEVKSVNKRSTFPSSLTVSNVLSRFLTDFVFTPNPRYHPASRHGHAIDSPHHTGAWTLNYGASLVLGIWALEFPQCTRCNFVTI